MTPRQEEILTKIIQEYIACARPVSSQVLERKYRFGICSATIRIEMHKLTKGGYLYQPHPSAGRIPTDKGYRFFVNNLLEKGVKEIPIEGVWENETTDNIKFFHSLTKKLAKISRLLVVSYLKKENIFWKEGWEIVLKEPEFREKKYFLKFVDFLNELEEKIEEFNDFFERLNSEIQVYIGNENPFEKARDFSTIFFKFCPPGKEEGIFSFLGPKRMAYDKSLAVINSLKKMIEKME